MSASIARLSSDISMSRDVSSQSMGNPSIFDYLSLRRSHLSGDLNFSQFTPAQISSIIISEWNGMDIQEQVDSIRFLIETKQLSHVVQSSSSSTADQHDAARVTNEQPQPRTIETKPSNSASASIHNLSTINTIPHSDAQQHRKVIVPEPRPSTKSASSSRTDAMDKGQNNDLSEASKTDISSYLQRWIRVNNRNSRFHGRLGLVVSLEENRHGRLRISFPDFLPITKRIPASRCDRTSLTTDSLILVDDADAQRELGKLASFFA
jgi:hypothetical protein